MTGGDTLSEEAELINAVIQGSERAVNEFVRLYAPRAYAIFSDRFGFDRATSEDLFQQLFLSLSQNNYRKLRSWRGESSFPTWFTVVCRNLAIDHTRSSHYQARQERPRDEEDPEDCLNRIHHNIDTVNEVHTAQLRRKVAELVEFLPETDQDVIRLFYHEGLPYGEIANLTGLSATNVGVRLSRARSMLKRLIGAHAPGLMSEYEDR